MVRRVYGQESFQECLFTGSSRVTSLWGLAEKSAVIRPPRIVLPELSALSLGSQATLSCDLTSSHRPPPPLRQAPGATPSRGADFESILAVFHQNWTKTVENEQKRPKIDPGPKSTLKRGLDRKGGGVCGWMVKSQTLSSFPHSKFLEAVGANLGGNRSPVL